MKSTLSKLKTLYLNDLIDPEEYRRDYDPYSTALRQAEEISIEEQPSNFTAETLS